MYDPKIVHITSTLIKLLPWPGSCRGDGVVGLYPGKSRAELQPAVLLPWGGCTSIQLLHHHRPQALSVMCVPHPGIWMWLPTEQRWRFLPRSSGNGNLPHRCDWGAKSVDREIFLVGLTQSDEPSVGAGSFWQKRFEAWERMDMRGSLCCCFRHEEDTRVASRSWVLSPQGTGFCQQPQELERGSGTSEGIPVQWHLAYRLVRPWAESSHAVPRLLTHKTWVINSWCCRPLGAWYF